MALHGARVDARGCVSERFGQQLEFTESGFDGVNVQAWDGDAWHRLDRGLGPDVSSLAVFYTLDCSGYSFPNDLAPHHYELLVLLAWFYRTRRVEPSESTPSGRSL